MNRLLLVPLDDTVVFPTMDVTLPVDAGDEARVEIGVEVPRPALLARTQDRRRVLAARAQRRAAEVVGKMLAESHAAAAAGVRREVADAAAGVRAEVPA